MLSELFVVSKPEPVDLLDRSEASGSLLRFLDFGYLMVSELFGCDWVHLRESYQQLYEDLERLACEICGRWRAYQW